MLFPTRRPSVDSGQLLVISIVVTGVYAQPSPPPAFAVSGVNPATVSVAALLTLPRAASVVVIVPRYQRVSSVPAGMVPGKFDSTELPWLATKSVSYTHLTLPTIYSV